MIKQLFLALALLLVVVFTVPGLSFAAGTDLFDPKATCSNPEARKESAACNASTDNPISGTNGVIIKIANIVTYIAGAAAVIVMIYSGLKFITAAGDSAKVKNARDTVLYALIGVAVIVLSRSLIIFVIHKLN